MPLLAVGEAWISLVLRGCLSRSIISLGTISLKASFNTFFHRLLICMAFLVRALQYKVRGKVHEVRL